MPAPAAPRPNSPSRSQLAGLVVIAILVLIGLAQCGSGTQHSSTPDSAETSETAPPTSEPIVEAPVTPSPPAAPAPVSEPEPTLDPAYEPDPEPAYEPDPELAYEPIPEPAYEPDPEPAYEPDPEPAYVPDYSDGSSSGSAYYKNCTAARAAGVTPLYAGDPGYASHLDRDGDGVACE